MIQPVEPRRSTNERIETMIKRLIRDEAGQDVIEWGMLAAFLSILMIAAVTTISPIILGWYTAVQTAIAP
ncbi:MAG: Flp family type IVb pilin [candidate division Zixibacteria bacterium]|nr:Flp family type IVb pilin [candidate division Zixibacteria bacterium]